MFASCGEFWIRALVMLNGSRSVSPVVKDSILRTCNERVGAASRSHPRKKGPRGGATELAGAVRCIRRTRGHNAENR